MSDHDGAQLRHHNQIHAYLESFGEKPTLADRVEYWRQRLYCLAGRHHPFDWFDDDFSCLFCGAQRPGRRRFRAYITAASAGIALATAIYLPLILWR